MEAFKKGGKVKKKKQMKQKQNVKQSVVVKINTGPKRRAYAPRVARPQPYINVYTPPNQDQSAYKALRDQLKELQKEKESKIVKAQAPEVVADNTALQNVRERQQREYEQVIANPEVPIQRSEIQPKPRVRAKTQPIASNAYINKLIEEHNRLEEERNAPVKKPVGPPSTPVARYVQELGKASENTPQVTVAHRGVARAQPPISDDTDVPVKRGRGRPKGSKNNPKPGEGIPQEPKRRSKRNFKVTQGPIQEFDDY